VIEGASVVLGSVCTWLSIEDLFVAGIGLEISGAVLLAIGLFTTPGQVATDVKFHLNAGLVRELRNSIDATFGLLCLVLGFVLQAIGYLLLLARDTSVSVGGEATAVALLVLVVPSTLVWIVWLKTRRPLLISQLNQLALYDNHGTKHDRPVLEELVMFAEILGVERRADEYDEDGRRRYTQRVFGVSRFRHDPNARGELVLEDD
jgi:hypothetical protein